MRKRIGLAALLLALLPVIAMAAEFAVVTGGRLNLRQTSLSPCLTSITLPTRKDRNS